MRRNERVYRCPFVGPSPCVCEPATLRPKGTGEISNGSPVSTTGRCQDLSSCQVSKLWGEFGRGGRTLNKVAEGRPTAGAVTTDKAQCTIAWACLHGSIGRRLRNSHRNRMEASATGKKRQTRSITCDKGTRQIETSCPILG